jgi:hypothetical protein
MLAVAYAGATLAAGPQDQAAPQSIHIQHTGVPALKTGADWSVKSVTIRRAYSHDAQNRRYGWMCCEYARVEVWITNMDIDICAVPEAHQATISLAFGGPDDYAALWSGVERVHQGQVSSDLFLARTNFVDQWAEEYGAPVVFSWGQSLDQVKQFFPDRSRSSSRCRQATD